MTRDELKKDITGAIDEVVPENIELDGDDIDSIETALEQTIESATGALDAAADEEDEDA